MSLDTIFHKDDLVWDIEDPNSIRLCRVLAIKGNSGSGWKLELDPIYGPTYPRVIKDAYSEKYQLPGGYPMTRWITNVELANTASAPAPTG